MILSESPSTAPAPQPAKVSVPWLVLVLGLLLLAGHVYLVRQQISSQSPVGPEINHMVRGSEALLGNRQGLGRHPHPYDYILGLHLLHWPGDHRPVSTNLDTPLGAQLDDVTMQWVATGMFSSSDSPLIGARWTTLLLSVLLGLTVLWISRKYWGDAGGLLSLALYCYSPNVLGHAALATPDLVNALVLMVLAIWTWRTGCRMNKSDVPTAMWAMLLLVLLCVLQWAMAGKPQPTAIWGSSWYLNGRTFAEHPTGYFLYTFFIKTPLATLVVLVTAQCAWAMQNGQRRKLIQHSWPMICIVLSTLITAARVIEPAGYRQLLPMMPAMFVLAGSVMRVPTELPCKHAKAVRNARAICLLAASVLVLQMTLFPQTFLAFTNQAARQQDAIYPHLALDNNDWGQDHHRAAVEADYLASFGPMAQSDPATREKSLLQWQDTPLHGGRYVISSNYLAGAAPLVLPRDWTRQMEGEYQRLLGYFRDGLLNMPRFASHQHGDAMPQLSHEQWLWLRLRLARICAHLRIRQPDAVIGRTMLVYQLSDEQVQFIMATPPFIEQAMDAP